jgi:hypothetical protein
MSDSHGSAAPGGGLIFMGLATIPIVAIAGAFRHNYLIDTYGAIEKIPAKEILINHNYQLGFGALLFLGLCVMFPLGVYNMAKSHMGH